MKRFIVLTCLLAIQTCAWAQVRPNINSFSSADRTLLATLMMQHITPAVIQDHCVMVMIGGGMIHSDFNFLPFHRMYIERMEDFLIQQGYPQFVPLPYWNPEAGGVPIELQVVDPDCASASCDPSHPASSCGSSINWNPGNALPANLKLPVVAGPNNDICDYFMLPTTPINDNATTATGLSRKIETPWHDGVHVVMGGVMGNFRSPAVPAFFLWHAYVDDVWKKWECNCTQSGMVGTYDIYMKDNNMVVPAERDRGEEPDIDMGPMWTSEDIWVRNQNDGLTNHTHQNPEYMAMPGNYNYVYVRVRNRGCIPTSPADNLALHWAKASTSLNWPNHWNGSITSPALMGDLVSTQPIPVIQPGSSAIIEFAWQPPNPATYAAVGTDPIFYANEPWHFCLVARVLSSGDPMTFPETVNLNNNVRNNNNIIWKNLTVVDLNPLNIVGPGGPWENDRLVGAQISIGDPWGQGGFYNIEFANPATFNGNPVTAEAEIKVTLDAPIWQRWQSVNFAGENVQVVNAERHQIRITGSPAIMRNVYFGPGERHLAHVSYNFLTRVKTNQREFDFSVIQRSENGVAIGGEKYHLLAPKRPLFLANAGQDITVPAGQNVEFHAQQLNESAIYNWYSNGTLVHTGPGFAAVMQATKTLRLEVIARADGYKDYDDITITVRKSGLVSLTPNPAKDKVEIGYFTTDVKVAHLEISRPFSAEQTKYPLNVNDTKTTIDVSKLSSGVYNVTLFCNGEAVEVKSLVIE